MQTPSATANLTQPKRRWRRQAPKEGDSEVLQRRGKTYFWCGKCRLWNTTHKINEHIRGGPPQDDAPTVQHANVATNNPSDSSVQLNTDQPTAFYSSLPITSFPSDTSLTPYQQGTSLALYSNQRKDLLRCQQEIDNLSRQLSLLQSQNTVNNK